MARYLHGIHDEGGEALHGDKPGWTLFTEEVGLNPNAPGRDYTHISGRGIGVIVRLNHAYGSGGTIPASDKYQQFAAACASWATRSKGVEWYVIANEPNGEWERPEGVVITPEDYARCFLLCSEAIKRAVPGAKVMHAAIGPYHASPTPWHLYLHQVLRIVAPSGLCDALNFHAYARSMTPDELLSQVKMDAPLQGKHYGFLTILDAIDEVPREMLNLPAFITEFDVYGGWENQNTGIITAMYDWVDDWNVDGENLPKFQAAVIFRWLGPPDVENVHDWEVRNKPKLQEDFRSAAIGRGYTSPVMGAQTVQDQTFIPAVSVGTAPTQPQPELPPVEWDKRLTARGVSVETPPLRPGQSYWRVAKARWYDEQEADALGPDHHIMADALAANGTRMAGVNMEVKWPTGQHVIFTEPKPGEPYSANYPMSPSRNEYGIKVGPSGEASETLKGIGMGAETPSGFNAGIHTSTGVVFQLATAPVASKPQPPTTEPKPEPATVPPLAHPIADPALRVVSQSFGDNPQDYAKFGMAGHNGVDYAVPEGTQVLVVDDGAIVEAEFDEDGYGTYVKVRHRWGESLYAHLGNRVTDLRPVKKGELIGLSGNTGNSTGPHLHFGMRVNPYTRGAPYDGYSDPQPYLEGEDESKPITRHDMVKAIALAAMEFDVDSDLLLSQAWAESSFNPNAVSGAGAKGLMQIMPATWAEWSAKIGAGNDPFDARQNARVGAAYMKWLMQQTRFSHFDSLVAYGWGIGNWLNHPGGTADAPEIWLDYATKIEHGRDLLKAIGA